MKRHALVTRHRDTRPDASGPAPRGKWGYKAYGTVAWFRTRRELMEHALEWLMATDGAEQERAASILSAAEAHVRFTDTDASAREGALSLDEAGLPAFTQGEPVVARAGGRP